MSHILIDTATGSPVPLPFHTVDEGGQPVTIDNFREDGKLLITWAGTHDSGWYAWEGLEVVTEAEFMAHQSTTLGRVVRARFQEAQRRQQS